MFQGAGAAATGAGGRVRRELEGLGLLVLSATAFATLGVFTRTAYEGGATALGLLVIRYGVAVAVLWPLLVVLRVPLRQPVRRVLPSIVLGVMYAAGALGMFVALARLPAGLTILLLYTYPVWVIALGPLVGERLGPGRLLSLLLAMGGLVLVAGFHGGTLDLVGLAAILASALLVALYVLSIPRVTQHVPTLVVTTYMFSSCAVVSLLIGGLGGARFDLTPLAWAAAVAIGVVCTVVSNLALVVGVRRVGPARGAIVSTLEPLLAVLLAAVVLGERMEPLQLVGGAAILAAVLLAGLPARAGRLVARRP